LKYNIDFIEETSPNVWWYDGQKITFRSPSSAIMMDAITSNPDITLDELSEKAEIVTSAVKKQLRQWIDKGYVQRSEKDGSWYVFASQSV